MNNELINENKFISNKNKYLSAIKELEAIDTYEKMITFFNSTDIDKEFLFLNFLVKNKDKDDVFKIAIKYVNNEAAHFCKHLFFFFDKELIIKNYNPEKYAKRTIQCHKTAFRKITFNNVQTTVGIDSDSGLYYFKKRAISPNVHPYMLWYFNSLDELKNYVGDDYFSVNFNRIEENKNTALLDNNISTPIFITKHCSSDKYKFNNKQFNEDLCLIQKKQEKINEEIIPLNNYKELKTVYGTDDEESIKIGYISDLHLTFYKKFKDYNNVTNEDVANAIRDAAQDVLKIKADIVLILGDICDDIELFDLFCYELNRQRSRLINIVFVLGNHELSSNEEIKQVKKYKDIIEKYNCFYLLHNEIILFDKYRCSKRLSYDEIYKMNKLEALKIAYNSNIVLFGGPGFDGYHDVFTSMNDCFNVDSFALLYKQVANLFLDRKVIVATHLGFEQWIKTNNICAEWVYVSGHNHRNRLYIKNNAKFLQDNQIGYTKKHYEIKTFTLIPYFDYFQPFSDGIHNISKEEYLAFMRNKNLITTISWPVNELFLIKSKKYYCFIHKTKDNRLQILNGGQRKTIKQKSLKECYKMIDIIVDAATFIIASLNEKLNAISSEVKSFGGNGSIHGCIVDIDFISHIFFNPFDGTIVGYAASDMTNKYVYSDIAKLIKDCCPHLLHAYKKSKKSNVLMLDSATNNVLNVKNVDVKNALYKTSSEGPVLYKEKDVYSMSLFVKKMQKLNDNILTFWIDDIDLLKNAFDTHLLENDGLF